MMPALAAGNPVGDTVYRELLARHDGLVDIWPGFRPQDIPVALFDGKETILLNHPNPPEGFREKNDIRVFDGRFPQVSANSSTEIGGVLTATIMPMSEEMSSAKRIGLMAHEMFHVHQRVHHPDWSGNEADVFTYPYTNPKVMESRIVEERALRTALLAADESVARCNAALAMRARADRYALLADNHRVYEQKSELNEGLAQYVEVLYSGMSAVELMPETPYAPAAIRWRVYKTGAALALLLDRFMPDWKKELSSKPGHFLDELLTGSLAEFGDCAVADQLHATAKQDAQDMIAAYLENIAALEADYLGATGLQVRIVANSPLWPNGFDPLNVMTLPEGRVLHSRFLKLSNETGVLEVLGRSVLTHGNGEHPLFNGVNEVVLTGLSENNLVTGKNNHAMYSGDSLSFEFKARRIEQSGDEVVVFLD
jgi:hypothetical protein